MEDRKTINYDLSSLNDTQKDEYFNIITIIGTFKINFIMALVIDSPKNS
jgi:hypothetical protein